MSKPLVEMTVSEADMKRITDILRRLPRRDAMSGLGRGFLKAGAHMEKALKHNVSNGILKNRKGKLGQSIGFRIDTTQSESEIIIGSGVRTGKRMKYANIHETGGTIKPKRGKYLTIPTSENKTKSGNMRMSARKVIERGGFFQTSKNGNPMIFSKSGETIKPMFILKESVRIPARRYLSKTRDQEKGKVVRLIVEELKKEVR